MAHEQSVQLLAFNFGSRTFSDLRLVQRLNRSLSDFNSTVREYLDPLVKADKCAQNVDDIDIAAHRADELVQNIESVFIKTGQAAPKLSMAKCAFGLPNSIPWQKHHLQRRCTNRRKLEEHHTTEVREVTTTVHWFCPLLSSVYSTTGCETPSALQTAAKRRLIRTHASPQRCNI